MQQSYLRYFFLYFSHPKPLRTTILLPYLSLQLQLQPKFSSFTEVNLFLLFQELDIIHHMKYVSLSYVKYILHHETPKGPREKCSWGRRGKRMWCDGVCNSIILGSVEVQGENWVRKVTRHRTRPSRVVGEGIVKGAPPMPDTRRFTHSLSLFFTHTQRKVRKTCHQFLKLTYDH